MTRPSIPSTLLACVLIACDTPTGPRVVGFERVSPPPGPFTPQVFGDDGQLTIQAVFPTPCEAYDATASAHIRAGVLRLIVRGDATGPCPLDVIGAFFYRATVTNLAPGHYAIRAIHTYADANWAPDSLDFGSHELP